MNNVVLIGRWARENELRFSASGVAVLKNAIAVNRPFSKTKEVDFFDVTVFGKLAENVANYTTKGRLIGIAGRMQQEKWETDAGDKRSKVVVIATEVEFLEYENKNSQQPSNQSESTPSSSGFQPMDDSEFEDDMPF